MFQLHSEKARQHLREHLPEITKGGEEIKQALAIEVAERAAEVAPTRIFDNAVRSKVFAQFNRALDDFLDWLESLT